jgi:hypothetical protein
MTTETTYSPKDLKTGTCKCCRETSNEIVKGEDLCIDCLEEIKFLELCSEAEYDMIPHMYEKD